MPREISELITKFNMTGASRELLLEAVTHRSYAAEHSLKYNNQRLEFLGDAVLQIIITEYLYNRFPDKKEGQLTKMRSALARQVAFAELARKMSLDEYMRMGKGEKKKQRGEARFNTLRRI